MGVVASYVRVGTEDQRRLTYPGGRRRPRSPPANAICMAPRAASRKPISCGVDAF
jgi:hypothetical protein